MVNELPFVAELPWLRPTSGTMGECLRSFDWSQTPFSSAADWPTPLPILVNLISGSQPMFMAWGPSWT